MAGVSVLIAGCGGSSSTGSHQTAAASLKRAAYVSTNAPGFKAAMTMQVSVDRQGSGQKTVNVTASGSVSPASHTADMDMHMQVPTSGGTQSIDMRMVLAHETMYMKLPPSVASKLPNAKPWISMNLAQIGKAAGIPGYSSLLNSGSNFSDPGQYLDFLRASADGTVKDLGQADVNGVQTTHYRAQVDLAKLPDSVPSADRKVVRQLFAMLQKRGANTQMPVDAWIDGSHQIRRLHIAYNLSVHGASVTMDITENLSDYGSQPAPAVPSPSETTNLLSLMHHTGTTVQG